MHQINEPCFKFAPKYLNSKDFKKYYDKFTKKLLIVTKKKKYTQHSACTLLYGLYKYNKIQKLYKEYF